MNHQEKIPGVQTPEEKAAALRKLSDAFNEIIHHAFRPLTDEERQARLSVAAHQRFRESLNPRPVVDPIDELVGELRNLKPENSEP